VRGMATLQTPYLVLDVFTDTPLEGNALGVFPEGERIPAELLQRAARELNLSESVFFLPPRDGGDVRLRIFTPAVELPFAGHPCLGAAFVVAEATGKDAVVLETGAGNVPVELRREDGRVVFGWMEQPIPSPAPYDQAEALLAGLGVEGSELPVELYANGPRHVYVVLGDEEAVASLTPDLNALGRLPVGINVLAGAGTRWKTRMFGPSLGVPEDPATGSAAGPLALHLARHGRTPFGQEIVISQGAEIGRPSVLHARVDGSAAHVERVAVGGAAVQVASGTYRLR
jgi:trans-2,3-dihydro-3-hydroxyanthranilate isomerase